jgi:hypothetical protein
MVAGIWVAQDAFTLVRDKADFADCNQLPSIDLPPEVKAAHPGLLVGAWIRVSETAATLSHAHSRLAIGRRRQASVQVDPA